AADSDARDSGHNTRAADRDTRDSGHNTRAADRDARDSGHNTRAADRDTDGQDARDGRTAARRRLGLDPARPVVPVLIGPGGRRRLTTAVRALLTPGTADRWFRSGRPQLIVVTDRSRASWPADLVRVAPVTELPRLLPAADVVVTGDRVAAGRAAAAGIPVVFYRPVTPHAVATAAALTVAGAA